MTIPSIKLSDTMKGALVGATGAVVAATIAIYPSFKSSTPVTASSTAETSLRENPRDFRMWNDSKDEYIWFNAQYRLANDFHDKNHYDSIVRQHIKFTFIMIEPDTARLNDYLNFRAKFRDFRRFVKKMNKQGKDEGYDVSGNLGSIYLFREESKPAISFFITKARSTGKEKVIVYFEEPTLIEDRRPEFCLETYNAAFIKTLRTRANRLIEGASERNILRFDEIISTEYDDTYFFLQEKDKQ